MTGKTCLVTGATSGIGKEAALGLAQMGARVIIVGRDAERTRQTMDWLQRETRNPNIESLLADLSSLSDVRKLAAAVKAKYGKLDVLINNAGAIFAERTLTADGVERTWAVNHLAYFALTLELLDLLKASAPARVVNVASAAHQRGKIEFDNLNGEKNYSSIAAYSQSKLANIMFTFALARRLKNTRVTANCLHPGVVATGFGRNNRGFLNILFSLLAPFLINSARGAKTSIYLAASPEVEGVSGKYFAKCAPARSSPMSLDEAAQEKLWAVSLKQAGLAGP